MGAAKAVTTRVAKESGALTFNLGDRAMQTQGRSVASMMKKFLVFSGQVLLLTVVGFVSMALAALIVPQPAVVATARTVDSSSALPLLLLMRLILALLVAFVARASLVRGLRLTLYLFWLFFGLTTAVMQLETLIFAAAFPLLTPADVGLIVLTNLVATLLFVPLVAPIMGSVRGGQAPVASLLPPRWPVRLLILGAVYPVLYFFFGFVVAWQFAAVRDFYATTTITHSQLLLTVIQFGRGVLWVLAGLPLFAMFATRRTTILAALLCYAVLPSIALILPNPLMPVTVRIPHLIEISASMAIFGLLAGVVMTYPLREKAPQGGLPAKELPC